MKTFKKLFEEELDEAGDKTSFECMECGKKFKKKIGKGEVKCPSCKSTDLEVD